MPPLGGGVLRSLCLLVSSDESRGLPSLVRLMTSITFNYR